MTLLYQPKLGEIIMCDFRGYEMPEMVKTRPVVVIARHPDNKNLVTIIPLSTTEPFPLKNYHHRLTCNPLPDKIQNCWAKCDMIATVSLKRLDRYRWKSNLGKREFIAIHLDSSDFQTIKKCVATALGFHGAIK